MSGEARTLRRLPQHWVHSHKLKKMNPSTLRMPNTRPGTMVGRTVWVGQEWRAGTGGLVSGVHQAPGRRDKHGRHNRGCNPHLQLLL